MEEEIFGPILPVLAVDSVDAAVEFVLDRPKPLALYVFSGSAETVDDVVDRTSSGGVCVNHVVMHIMPNEMPFGGVGPSRPDPKIHNPPNTRVKEKIIRTAM